MTDIFQDQFRKSSIGGARFFTFEKVEDKIQGTFIKRHQVTGDKFRGDCFNYEIMDQEGSYWLVNGGKGGVAVLDKEMMNVKPGMLVGIKLVELRDTGKVNPAKIYEVYYDESMKNEEWLRGQSGQIQFQEEMSSAQPTPVQPQPTQGDLMEKTKRIMDLAKIKLGAIDANDAKTKIVENTGLAFISQNQDLIIQKLEAMQDIAA